MPFKLIADAFYHDQRVLEAKKLLLESLQEHSSSIKGIKPADPGLKSSYDDLINLFDELRGGKIWFPYLGSGIGNGALVELLDGSVKYDCICGIGPHFWGHSHPALVESAIDAAISDTVMQGNLQQNGDSVELSKLLVNASGLSHCFLSTSGAMANDNALKIAFQRTSPASRILAFEKCFIGRSLAGSQITDKPSFREGLPLTYQIDYLPYYDFKDPQGSLDLALSTLKKHIRRYPGQHAVIIFELVQGEGGFYSGTKEFFLKLMELAKENGIAVFVDEIQTFGRTPELFAFQYYDLKKYVDIVSIGKLSQVCATLFSRDYKPKPGLLSQTFTASTSAIRTGKVLIEGLLNGNYFGPHGKIQKIHDYFTQKLEAIAAKHPSLIQGPFGVGCMIAFTPYDGDAKLASQLALALFEAGVISFIAGSSPTRIRFLLPAGAISKEDLNAIADILETVLVKEAKCLSSGL